MDPSLPVSPQEPAAAMLRCANCGQSLEGPFCHLCGQEAKSLDPSMRDLFGEFLSGLVAFDSRILRTLVPLVLRPGFLTVEHYAGRRVPYVRPLTLYFFFSFLMFLALGWSGYSVVQTHESFEVEKGRSSLVTLGVGPSLDEDPAPPSSDEEPSAQALDDDPSSSDPLNSSTQPDGQSSLNQRIEATLGQVVERHKKDPAAFNGLFRSLLSKTLFVLVPVFAGLLHLLYRRHGWVYVRHLVLALHIHSFAFLQFTVVALLDWTTHPVAKGVGAFVSLAVYPYTFMALRRVYGQGRRRTGLKLFLLMAAYLVALGVSILFVVFASVFLD